jgi:hypothetical protein
MLTHFVSPRFGHKKLEPPFYRDVVDVFEDRMRGWLLEPALKLLDLNDCSIASVSLSMNYFEGIEIYHSGEDSKYQSSKFFRRGFLRVFRMEDESAALQERLVDDLYNLLRCGFAHDSMFRSGINFSTVRKEPLLVTMKKKEGQFDPSVPLESVVINPRAFVESVERHFTIYVRELRRAQDEQLKENFKKAIALKWRLGMPGRTVGMTEEQFFRGDVPNGAHPIVQAEG